MSSDIIVYDADYLAEQARVLDGAMELLNEAAKDLQKASFHEGWKCQECNRINESLNDISTRLSRLTKGVADTALALDDGLESFTELESHAEAQAEELSSDLTENYGFESSSPDGQTVTLPVTQVPQDSVPLISSIAWDSKDGASSSLNLDLRADTDSGLGFSLESLLSSGGASGSLSSLDGSGKNFLELLLELLLGKEQS